MSRQDGGGDQRSPLCLTLSPNRIYPASVKTRKNDSAPDNSACVDSSFVRLGMCQRATGIVTRSTLAVTRAEYVAIDHRDSA